MEILCFLAGTGLYYIRSPWWLLILLIALFNGKPILRLTLIRGLWFLAAIAWCSLHQWLVVGDSLYAQDIIPNIHLQGYVDSIPVVTASKTQFQFQVTEMDHHSANALLILSCYNHCPEFRAGQVWQLQAKLHKPRNLANPGGFNYVGWLAARHIQWTGYIRNGTAQLIQQNAGRNAVLTLRQHMADALAKADSNPETLGITQALTLAVTTHIAKDSWDLFRRTGTTHLIVISGSHIALVAGFVYMMFRWLWSCSGRLCLFIPAQRVAAVGGMAMAVFYALLAGFEVPSQRALVACFFVLIRNFCSQRFTMWQGWRYALLAVLLLEPHSVTLPGFYLSFLAVAILVLTSQRFAFGRILQGLVLQVACLAGLMPLTLFWFSYGAINGLVANLVAIPWVGFVIVPLGLFMALTSEWLVVPWITMVLKISINWLLYFLHWVDSFNGINLNFPVTGFLSPLAWMVALCVLAFLPLARMSPVAVIIGITAMFPGHERIRPGEVRMDVLDVGQGLAVVLRTAGHQLIYDAGVRFYHGGDMGKMAIIPYLETLGVERLDKIIISHPDLDHRGGLAALEQRYPVGELIVDDPGFYKRGISCHQHEAWDYDGVSFRFFPASGAVSGKNNASCVLQVSTTGGRLLLTGDIEKPAENDLVARFGSQLASTVMLVPHHGSKTSSSPAFIQAVAPEYAIVSTGYANRYHFPHQQAMRVYAGHHTPVINTVDCGMVSVRLTGRGALPVKDGFCSTV